MKGNLSTSDYVTSFNAAKDENAINVATTALILDAENIMSVANNLEFIFNTYITTSSTYSTKVKYGEKVDLEAIKNYYLSQNILVDSLYYDEDYTEAYDLNTIYYNDVASDFALYAKCNDINVERSSANYGFVSPTDKPESDDVFTYTWSTKSKIESKSYTDTSDETKITKGFKTGGKSQADNNIKVTLTTKATIRMIFYSGGSDSRSVFIGKTISAVLDTSIASAASSGGKDFQVLEVELEAGEYYINYTNNVGILRLQAICTVEKMTIYNSLDVADVKTTYASGEEIDLTGLKISKTVDGTTSVVELTETEMTNVTYKITNEAGDEVTELTTGRYKVSVKFLNTTTVEFWITVE